MKRVLMFVLGIAVIAVVLAPRNLRACSCVFFEVPYFVLPDTIDVPVNFGGVPMVVPGHYESRYRRYFKFEIYGRHHMDFVPFRIEVKADERLMGKHGEMLLLIPRDGFRPNAKYRITYRSPWARGTCEIIVGEEKLTTSDNTLVIISDSVRVAEVEVADRAGSCSVVVTAAQTNLTAAWTDTSTAYPRAVMFFWEIEGLGRWQPSHSICRRPRLGSSWTGRNSTRIFAICGDKYRERTDALVPGLYEVRVIGILPGTSERWESTEFVEIRCDMDGDAEPLN